MKQRAKRQVAGRAQSMLLGYLRTRAPALPPLPTPSRSPSSMSRHAAETHRLAPTTCPKVGPSMLNTRTSNTTRSGRGCMAAAAAAAAASTAAAAAADADGAPAAPLRSSSWLAAPEARMAAVAGRTPAGCAGTPALLPNAAASAASISAWDGTSASASGSSAPATPTAAGSGARQATVQARKRPSGEKCTPISAGGRGRARRAETVSTLVRWAMLLPPGPSVRPPYSRRRRGRLAGASRLQSVRSCTQWASPTPSLGCPTILYVPGRHSQSQTRSPTPPT